MLMEHKQIMACTGHNGQLSMLMENSRKMACTDN